MRKCLQHILTITMDRKCISLYDRRKRIICASSSAIGHFTILAQELNVAVGCAASNFKTNDGYDTYLVACNYATTNFVTLPVYRVCSKAASECKSGTNPDYPALCSLNEKVKYN